MKEVGRRTREETGICRLLANRPFSTMTSYVGRVVKSAR